MGVVSFGRLGCRDVCREDVGSSGCATAASLSGVGFQHDYIPGCIDLGDRGPLVLSACRLQSHGRYRAKEACLYSHSCCDKAGDSDSRTFATRNSVAPRLAEKT